MTDYFRCVVESLYVGIMRGLHVHVILVRILITWAMILTK